MSCRRLILKPKWVQKHNFSTKVENPNPTKISTDMIGPMDPVSNLRRMVFRQPVDETPLERRYREMRIKVQEENQVFWTKHNTSFFKERENYLKNNLPEGQQTLTADEMSVFYKAFLDKNWRNHFEYNIQWYRKNFTLLGLALRVKMARLFKTKSS